MYTRGFLITNSRNNSVDGWRKIVMNSLNVWVNPDGDFHGQKNGDVHVAVIGKVIDPINNISDEKEILKRLSVKFSYSDDAFFDYLDLLSGRFVIVIEDENKAYILQDAAGNRSLFYDRDFKNFSSHAELIAKLTGSEWHEESQSFISHPRFYKIGAHFPGMLTVYKDVFKSIPNTLLDVKRGEVVRFFPREPLKENKINADLIEEVGSLLKTQVKLLNGKYKLSQSITAGLDSRITLAASKGFQEDVFYYTINGWDDHLKEIRVVQELCGRLDIEHHVLNDKGKDVDRFLENFLESNSYMTSKDRGILAKILIEGYPKDRLHLKSNLSEIGRAFYYEYRALLPNIPSANDLARLYGYNFNTDFVKNAFHDLVQVTHFDKKSLYNYNPYDMHYWEYRMGSWQSQGLRECDVAQDTFILFNSRHILKLMLSVPFSDRRKSALHYALINHLWPETMSVEVNPWVTHNKLDEAKRLARGMKFRLNV